MEINATITGIKYQVLLAAKLDSFNLKKFDINVCPTSCIIADDKINYAISKWVSPKRTRSYPYERVYNTLANGKKITVIPVVKDEGLDGDRDFLQWDTISLMSLLDVYVILAYYNRATKNPNYSNKITSQKFDDQYVLNKIQEISKYHSSALHWNLKELEEHFVDLVFKVKESYSNISQTLKVQMHSAKGIANFQKEIGQGVKKFMIFSRQKAKEAQYREFVTQQPKENLQTLTKSKITITNYLGGQYFLTVDEIKIENNIISLIEGKYSKSTILPSKNDIKDGLLKMILYTNLKKVQIEEHIYEVKSILLLTSEKLQSEINSNATLSELECFYNDNKLKNNDRYFVNTLFEEAKTNNFLVFIKKGSKK